MKHRKQLFVALLCAILFVSPSLRARTNASDFLIPAGLGLVGTGSGPYFLGDCKFMIRESAAEAAELRSIGARAGLVGAWWILIGILIDAKITRGDVLAPMFDAKYYLNDYDLNDFTQGEGTLMIGHEGRLSAFYSDIFVEDQAELLRRDDELAAIPPLEIFPDYFLVRLMINHALEERFSYIDRSDAFEDIDKRYEEVEALERIDQLREEGNRFLELQAIEETACPEEDETPVRPRG